MKFEKFLVEKQGGIVRWLPSGGNFLTGQLHDMKRQAAREAAKSRMEYPCIVVMEGSHSVDVYHTEKDFSGEGA